MAFFDPIFAMLLNTDAGGRFQSLNGRLPTLRSRVAFIYSIEGLFSRCQAFSFPGDHLQTVYLTRGWGTKPRHASSGTVKPLAPSYTIRGRNTQAHIREQRTPRPRPEATSAGIGPTEPRATETFNFTQRTKPFNFTLWLWSFRVGGP